MARAATTTDSFNAIAEPRRRDILTLLAAAASFERHWRDQLARVQARLEQG
jgi:hypothetical protein